MFSGIGTNLEAILSAGVDVEKYWAVEVDPVARMVAENRAIQMRQRFPFQVRKETALHLHTQLPQDVTLVTRGDLVALGGVDLVVAGWPCQGHSRAGGGRGFEDPRSQLFYELVRILRILQELQRVGYLLENVFSKEDRQPRVQQA